MGSRSLSIDLNWPEAREAALKLSQKADVIVENFRPGTMKTFGLDYETVRQRNQQLFTFHCPVMGRTRLGPHDLRLRRPFRPNPGQHRLKWITLATICCSQ